MLKGLLAQCCFPQLSLLSNSVRELIRIDFLSALPAELGFKILCYLDTNSLCKAAQVSSRWRSLADDNVVWHRMCEQHIDKKCTKCGWGLPLLEKKKLRATKRQVQLRATGRGLNTWSPNITPLSECSPGDRAGEQCSTSEVKQSEADSKSKNFDNNLNGLDGSNGSACPEDLHNSSSSSQRFRPWKDVYKDRFKVGSNWKHGRYSTKIFKGHTNGVMCLQFDDRILATGSYDATIKIWDLQSEQELRTLRGHTSGVRCLQFDENKLISGSLDSTLKVWNWRTGECFRTFTGHRAGVISLHFVSTLLVSGSIDKTVRLWNFEEKTTCVLQGHEDWVNAVKIDMPSRTVFSASDDLTVRLWDLDSKTHIKMYKGHVGQVQQVLPLPPEFEIEDADPELDSGDDSASTISGLDAVAHGPHHSPLRSTFGPSFNDGKRPLPPKYMLTSALDSTVRLWDVSTGKSLRTFFGHVEGVWALAADTLRVVSGAEDKMVKVWDARSGKCERTFYCHAGPVTCIGLSDSRLCTGSEDCEVRMLSFKPESFEDVTRHGTMPQSGTGMADDSVREMLAARLEAS